MRFCAKFKDVSALLRRTEGQTSWKQYVSVSTCHQHRGILILTCPRDLTVSPPAHAPLVHRFIANQIIKFFLVFMRLQNKAQTTHTHTHTLQKVQGRVTMTQCWRFGRCPTDCGGIVAATLIITPVNDCPPPAAICQGYHCRLLSAKLLGLGRYYFSHLLLLPDWLVPLLCVLGGAFSLWTDSDVQVLDFSASLISSCVSFITFSPTLRGL